ncbi:hypothetical protein [Roseivirga sp.]|uniref:hypothetical protein n=1 Tax=Roseivirga sp. TaxID=1964215 RepID=UPI003B8C9AAD
MDVLIAELDNHSETYLTSQALPLIERAEQVILHIECLNKEELGPLKVLFEGLRKHKKLANCVFSGEHAGLEQMLKMLRIPYKPYEGLESAQKLIEGILTDS